ncbi:tetratricopeptide repeat protein [Spirochaetota bacterium]
MVVDNIYEMPDEISKTDCNEEIEDLKELGKNKVALIDRGYEYVHNGEYSKAFRLFCNAIKLSDSDPEILNGLGISLCELGKLHESQRVLQRSARLNPEDAFTYANLAGVCWEQKDFNQAIYYYYKSINLDPKIEESYFNLINLYIETGSLYMALITCIEYYKRFPNIEDAKELLYDIILNLGTYLF